MVGRSKVSKGVLRCHPLKRRSSYTAAFAGFTWWEKRNRRKREGIIQIVYLKDFFLKKKAKAEGAFNGKSVRCG